MRLYTDRDFVEEEVKLREKQCSQVSTSGELLNKLLSDSSPVHY